MIEYFSPISFLAKFQVKHREIKLCQPSIVLFLCVFCGPTTFDFLYANTTDVLEKYQRRQKKKQKTYERRTHKLIHELLIEILHFPLRNCVELTQRRRKSNRNEPNTHTHTTNGVYEQSLRQLLNYSSSDVIRAKKHIIILNKSNNNTTAVNSPHNAHI